MNTPNRMSRWLGRGTASIVLIAAAAIGGWAQDTTITTIQHGPSSFDTKVRNAEIVYVEGNNLVLRGEDGKIEHLIVPATDKFTIDGQERTVYDLVPGTKLTQSITTSTAPRYVNTVRTLKGKIWYVDPRGSLVILTLPDNKNHMYKVPENAKITVSGEKKTIHDLRKGMTIEVTIVTDDTHTVVQQSKTVVGQAPPTVTPTEVGLLVFLQPNIAAPAPEASESQEQLSASLPQTASTLPLVGLLGALTAGTSVGLATFRRAWKA